MKFTLQDMHALIQGSVLKTDDGTLVLSYLVASGIALEIWDSDYDISVMELDGDVFWTCTRDLVHLEDNITAAEAAAVFQALRIITEKAVKMAAGPEHLTGDGEVLKAGSVYWSPDMRQVTVHAISVGNDSDVRCETSGGSFKPGELLAVNPYSRMRADAGTEEWAF